MCNVSLRSCFDTFTYYNMFTIIVPADISIMLTQSCLTLCDPIDCNLQGFSVQGILQVRLLEWAAISWFRDLLDSRSKPMSLLSPALAGIFFTTESSGKPPTSLSCHIIFFSGKNIYNLVF